MTTSTATHRIRWYVWGWDPDTGQRYKLPHVRTMRGTWGWDATCTCGWDSRTGGATRTSVERDVWEHKYDHADDAERDRLLRVIR